MKDTTEAIYGAHVIIATHYSEMGSIDNTLYYVGQGIFFLMLLIILIHHLKNIYERRSNTGASRRDEK